MEHKQVFNNAKWIVACKIVQSLLQLFVGMLCARYLGPSNYGLINYASSIVAFVTPLMKLGLDSTLVYELVQNPDKEGEIMGTSLLMNIVSSVVCIIGIVTFVSVVNAGDKVVIIVCVLYSLSLFFSALEMIQYWFQYKLLSKYASVVMLISYIFVSSYKIFLLISSKSVYWFALTNSIDFGIIGISLILLYIKKSSSRLTFSRKRAAELFEKSKYYIFASLMIVVYHNTDHIMLTMMAGQKENGIYSAAITCAIVVQFVYTAIIDSYRPLILTSKKRNEHEYEKNMSGLYCVITYLTVMQSIAFTVLAGIIVNILYGAEYADAIPVLRIAVWYIVFSVMGTVRNVWILAEEKQKYLTVINFSGAVINIVLNFYLIPVYGACGAAAASLATQFLINFLLGFIIKPLRKNNILLLRGINPLFFVKEIKFVFTKLLKK